MAGTLLCSLLLLVFQGGAAAQATPPEEQGVCARVRIKISQEVAITRAAFRATLEISNAPENVGLEQILVALDITDAADDSANDKFGIRPPELTGLSDVSGGGSISPGSTGKAVWTIIPSRDAAPNVPTEYFVGGRLEYVQGGAQVSIPLFPARIQVKPDPLLFLDYFLVREVYSDDPFTPDIVEPAEPFPLGLLLTNRGKGEARNVRITSSQPEIIDNEKGLLIDFKIIGTQVNTSQVSPSLSVNLGNLPPGGSAVAKWMMTSSLQGRFVEYDATFEHIDGLGDPRLSLIDSVEIHELTHAVRFLDPDDNKPDFLVNDISDPDHYPDTLYNSDGTISPVNLGLSPVIDGLVTPGDLQIQLTSIVPGGFVYIKADDPGQENYRLKQVLRSDGRDVLIGDNAWTTHRTIRLVGQPVYREHKVHIFDWDSTGMYTLVYEPFATGATALGGARALADGEFADLGGTEGLAVTALFEDGMYVEALDRSSGIRVTGMTAFEGERIAVQGTMATDVNGEKIIEASAVTKMANGTVQPLVVNLRAFYGGDFAYAPATGAGQKGMKGGFGLNLVGLFVKTAGTVVSSGEDRFVLGDGAGTWEVAVLLPEGVGAPPVGSLTTVVGAVSTEKVGDDLLPVLRPRRAGDIFPEDTGAIISNIQVTNVMPNGATIVWSTDRQSTSRVMFGEQSGNLTQTADGPDFVTGHIVPLAGLLPDTVYYFVVESHDYNSGTTAQSEEMSFRTLDTTLPSFTLTFPSATRSGQDVTAVARLANTGGTAAEVTITDIQVSPADVGIGSTAPLAFGSGSIPGAGALVQDLVFNTALDSFYVKLTVTYKDAVESPRVLTTPWKKVTVSQ